MGKARFNEAKGQIFGKERIAVERTKRIDIFDEIDPRELPPSERRKFRVTPERVTPEREPQREPPKEPPKEEKPAGQTTTPEPKTTADQTMPLQIEPKKDAATMILSDVVLQKLIRAIPFAAPGGLITDEYHNTLRAAVIAIGERLGLSLNPNAELGVLNFAPNFFPVLSPGNADERLNWTVTGDGALVPAISANELEKPVVGGCIISLPDLGDIHELVVWVLREETAPPPKEFEIALQRRRIGSDDDPQTLIAIDLKNVKKGVSEMRAELSEREIALRDEDEGETGQMTMSRRKIINNEKWVYSLVARFVASAETPALNYLINVIQITCNV